MLQLCCKNLTQSYIYKNIYKSTIRMHLPWRRFLRFFIVHHFFDNQKTFSFSKISLIFFIIYHWFAYRRDFVLFASLCVYLFRKIFIFEQAKRYILYSLIIRSSIVLRWQPHDKRHLYHLVGKSIWQTSVFVNVIAINTIPYFRTALIIMLLRLNQ